MADFIRLAWVAMFPVFFVVAFWSQLKTSKYLADVRRFNYEYFNDSLKLPGVFQASDQIRFVVFLLRRRYEGLPDEDLKVRGRKLRIMFFINSSVAIIFLVFGFANLALNAFDY